jgi:hypothetical protein
MRPFRAIAQGQTIARNPPLFRFASLSCQTICNNDWCSYQEGNPLYAYQRSSSVKWTVILVLNVPSDNNKNKLILFYHHQ